MFNSVEWEEFNSVEWAGVLQCRVGFEQDFYSVEWV